MVPDACGPTGELASISQGETYLGDDLIPLTLFRSRIIDHDAVHVFIRAITAVVPGTPVANAGHCKEPRCHPSILNAGRGRLFAKNVAGELFAGFGTDWTVKSAR